MREFLHHRLDGLLLRLFVPLVKFLILEGLLITVLDVSFQILYRCLLRRNQVFQPFCFRLILGAEHRDLLIQVTNLTDVLLMQLAHFAEHLHLHLLSLLHAIFALLL